MNDNQVMVTLPTIPKEVADAIETARKQGACSGTIIDVFTDEYTLPGVSGAVLRQVPLDTLLSALVNGYTVEKSAEELEREAHDRIRQFYRYHTTGVTDEEDEAYADGVLDTLDTLGIKIEGVNA